MGRRSEGLFWIGLVVAVAGTVVLRWPRPPAGDPVLDAVGRTVQLTGRLQESPRTLPGGGCLALLRLDPPRAGTTQLLLDGCQGLATDWRLQVTGRLRRQGLKVERQVQGKAIFDGVTYDPAFKLDMLVDDRLVLEIKAVEQLSKAHAKQLLTYLRLLKQPVGLLLNFSEATLKDGIRRVVNDYKPG